MADPEAAEEVRKEPYDEEFLKIMKQSKYSIVDQLKKTPARISILSLILSLQAHRTALQKVLDDAYVQPDVTPEKVINMINVAKAASSISFSEEEISMDSPSRPKALHITLKCQGFIVARVLIDGGSALNVLPLSTLEKLPFDLSHLENSDMIVRAFDGSRRQVIGNISLPLEIGPSTFIVEFQVMDIEPAYTMLLGRPWIHSAKAVPSTLHQRVKYVDEGKIVTVRGEEEILVSKPSSVPYIETAEQVTEDSFRSFEVEGLEGTNQNINSVAIKIMRKSGFEVGKGLGPKLQGRKDPLDIPENPNRQGLGFEPSLEELFKGKASLHGTKKQERKEIPHISETFPAPTEVMYSPNISMAEEDEEEEPDAQLWIKHDESGESIDNWELEMFPDVVSYV